MTTAPGHAPVQAFFVQGGAGDVFVVYHPACIRRAFQCDIIIVPPFAEEMNKSRRMLAWQARELAARGFGVLILDLYGTGESQGDFAQALWSIWRQDVAAACAWLETRGAGQIHLLGVRFGALLAMDVARDGGKRFGRVVLWQPVTNGENMMTQFLRMRIAASALGSGSEKETTQSLRERLARDEAIEVGGYEIAPELVWAIDALRLEPMADRGSPPIDWFDLCAEPGGDLSPASRRVIEIWQSKRVRINSRAVTGPAFWSSAEIAVAPELIGITADIFARSEAE
jgi:exosortase A-associated hydrolase 2